VAAARSRGVCVLRVCVCVCVEDAGVWFKGVYLRESGSDA